MSLTDGEAKELLSEALGKILSESDWDEGRLASEFSAFFDNWEYADELYDPDDHLISRIADYNQWYETRAGEDPGQLMEEIAFLSFRRLRGWESIKSYQSYAQQHDLVIAGSRPWWFILIKYLHLLPERRTILIEAKNRDDRVSDSDFSRLCGIIQNKLAETCNLGIFFTREGASGFSGLTELGETGSRQRSLRDARATQVLFHAKTGKFVVVLNHDDLQLLTQKGALPRILEAKIRDVEEAAGLSLQFNENWTETDLPPHLSQYENSAEADGEKP